MDLSRRAFLAGSGALIVSFGVRHAPAQTMPSAERFLGKPLAPDAVDSYLAVHADSSLTVFVGKVDIGTGNRIAMRQIAGEEMDLPLHRITLIEGDTALTPNQGATAGEEGAAREIHLSALRRRGAPRGSRARGCRSDRGCRPAPRAPAPRSGGACCSAGRARS